MKRMVLALTILSIPATLAAQDSESTFRYRGYGLAYFSVGSCQHRYLNVGVGGGGEGFLWRGLTLGADIGYFKFPADRNAGYGVLTLGPGYHFVNRNKPAKFDPYVSGNIIGLAFVPGGGAAGAGSLGGGVNYWFKERIGLHTGVQFQVIAAEEVVAQFRVGLTFR